MRVHVRDVWTGSVKFAIGALRVSPWTWTVALTLLIVATGVFGLTIALLDILAWRPIDVRAPHQLVRLTSPRSEDGFSWSEYQLARSTAHGKALALGWVNDLVLHVDTEHSERLANVWAVTDDFFPSLGEQALHGRLLRERDGHSHPRVAVVSQRWWRTHLRGSPEAIGRTIRIEGMPFEVIGVTRPGFTALTRGVAPDVTIPVTALRDLAPHAGMPDDPLALADWRGLGIGFRVPHDASASAVCHAVGHALVRAAGADAAHAQPHGCSTMQRGINASELTPVTRTVSIVLLLAVLLLVSGALAMSQVLTLMMVHRVPALVLRAALGAPPSVLTAHVAVLIVGTIACAIGVGLAVAAAAAGPVAIGLLDVGVIQPSLDTRRNGQLLASLSIALALCGGALGLPLVAAIRGRTAASMSLRHGSSPATPGVALSVGLHCAAVIPLALGTIMLALAMDRWTPPPAIDSEDVSIARLYPRTRGYEDFQADLYYPALMQRVQAISSVEAAAFSNHEPGGAYLFQQPVRGGLGHPKSAGVVVASPGLASLVGLRITRGRDIDWTDRLGSDRVAVVSESLASQVAGDGNPLGTRIRIGEAPNVKAVTVVGTFTGDQPFDVRRPSQPIVFVAWLQEPDLTKWAAQLIVRHRLGKVADRALAVAVQDGGREMVLTSVAGGDVARRALAYERLTAKVAYVLAGLAVSLLLLSVFTTFAQIVTYQHRELAIRAALGARPKDALAALFARGAGPAVAGVAVGCALWMPVRAALRARVELLPVLHPATEVAVVVILLAAIALAITGAALPVLRTQPGTTLRG